MPTATMRHEGQPGPDLTQARREVSGWMAGAALLACWGPLVWRLGRVWSLAPELAFGWAVPVLVLWMLTERRRDVPHACAPNAGGHREASILFGAGLVGFGVILPVLEANPLWPTAQWLATGILALATLAGWARTHGWRAAGHYAFPVAFFFTALSWPTFVNVQLIGRLAAAGAQVVAEVVSLSGYPANAKGNVIEVGRGFVGIDEACSGLRSFQTVWMTAWFLGELLRLSWSRRVALVGLAMLAAWGTNMGRIGFLTWQTAAHGVEAGNRWHDTAGDFELVAALLTVVALAWATARGTHVAPELAPAPDRARGWTRGTAWCLLAGGLGAETLTQAWYGWHERDNVTAAVHWHLVAPTAAWHPTAVPPRVDEVLQSTSARGLEWRDEKTGLTAAAYVVSWQGDVAHGETADWHDPTICLPAAGARLVRDLGPEPVVIDGVKVVFNSYLFDAGGTPLTVYFCHWDAETGPTPAPPANLAARRLERVWQGRRRGDVAHLALIAKAAGPTALNWLHTWAPKILSTREPETTVHGANH